MHSCFPDRILLIETLGSPSLDPIECFDKQSSSSRNRLKSIIRQTQGLLMGKTPCVFFYELFAFIALLVDFLSSI